MLLWFENTHLNGYSDKRGFGCLKKRAMPLRLHLFYVVMHFVRVRAVQEQKPQKWFACTALNTEVEEN